MITHIPKVENSHRVLREGDQNVTMDELLKREGLKPVSGKHLKNIAYLSKVLYYNNISVNN